MPIPLGCKGTSCSTAVVGLPPGVGAPNGDILPAEQVSPMTVFLTSNSFGPFCSAHALAQSRYIASVSWPTVFMAATFGMRANRRTTDVVELGRILLPSRMLKNPTFVGRVD
jgi:hypothetical protein